MEGKARCMLNPTDWLCGNSNLMRDSPRRAVFIVRNPCQLSILHAGVWRGGTLLPLKQLSPFGLDLYFLCNSKDNVYNWKFNEAFIRHCGILASTSARNSLAVPADHILYTHGFWQQYQAINYFMDGACTCETVGSYEATFHFLMTDWMRLIRVYVHMMPVALPLFQQALRAWPMKINTAMGFYSRSYLNSAVIGQLHLLAMNSLLAAGQTAHLFMSQLWRYTTIIIDYTFIQVESCHPLYFAEKVDLAHSEIEVE